MGRAGGAAAGSVDRRARRISVIALAALVVVAGVWSINPRWEARNDNPKIAIAAWARWNYTGYEKKAAWPEY